MKDLLIITSYCPDDSRENILRELVCSLTKFKNKYDIMVVSHTPVPTDIQKKVNYFLYDYKNEILTDWFYLNQPWFSPNNNRKIQSSFLSKKNTILAMWRMMILGFSLAKNLGYTKVHQIEYDCKIIDDIEITENSKLLENYNSVVYYDNKDSVDEILFGSFQSHYLPNLDELLINLDENKIKTLIKESDTKSPEVLLDRILKKSNIFKKNKELLNRHGNKFGIYDGQVGTNFNPWSVPFYDKLDDHIYFIVWNSRITNGVEIQIMVNNSEIFNLDSIPLNHWRLIDLGHISKIKNILTIENKQVRDFYELNNDYEIDLFKKMSFID